MYTYFSLLGLYPLCVRCEMVTWDKSTPLYSFKSFQQKSLIEFVFWLFNTLRLWRSNCWDKLIKAAFHSSSIAPSNPLVSLILSRTDCWLKGNQFGNNSKHKISVTHTRLQWNMSAPIILHFEKSRWTLLNSIIWVHIGSARRQHPADQIILKW